ncbi:MAG TPA: M64 family metallopeptidase, partial [Longimicrobium sp.]|nr:M64 family metallopeptidase [Longimicrobium sp.]
EMGAYQAHCEGFVNHLLATPPFDVMAGAINVFRIDVASRESGADEPTACGGSGARPRTFFDASFCGFGTQRLLVVKQETALRTARRQVPRNHVGLVIVNSTTFGGSGGGVAVFSVAEHAFEIGLHERGHTFFKLADEYPTLAGCESGESGHDTFGGREPREVNATRERDPARVKWRSLITPGTPIPTTRNPDCRRCDPQPSPVPPGTVGLFEGSRYFHCGLFRPEFDCKMRTLGKPFCAVCSAEIVRKLNRFRA